MRWLIRSEEDPTCKCIVHAKTMDEALRIGGCQIGVQPYDLFAVESPDTYSVTVKCSENVRTARLTLGEWRDLAKFAQGLCLPSNPPSFIVVGGIVVWSNE